MDKLLFTGGSGFLGYNIRPALEREYDVVHSLGIGENDDIKYNLAKEVPPINTHYDVVLHAAGKAHTVPNTEAEAQVFYDVNYQGTVNLCKALENAGIPKALVFISTVAVYGCEFGELIDETHPLNGDSPYAKSKIMAEEYLTKWCSEHNVVLGILRPSLLAGKNAPGNLGAMVNGIKKGFYLNIAGGRVKKSVLMAEDIANLELRPTYVSVVDDTGIGNDVIEKLKRHKVNTDYIVRTPDGLGTWLAIFDNNGDVVASISKRPDLSPIKEVIDKYGDEIISNSDSVVVEIDMEADLLKQIFDLAEKYHKQIFAVVSNMSIAMERRDLISRVSCVVCNDQEASLLFSEDYDGVDIDLLQKRLVHNIANADIEKIVVTLGDRGAIYADKNGDYGFCPPQKVDVIDTTGAGDSFFAGIAVGLTYGKSLRESCSIGTRLASAVIATKENVSPRFQPAEFGLPSKD